MAVAAIAVALLGGAITLYGVWQLVAVDPESDRYQQGSYDFIGPGIRNLLADQRRASAWVLAGSALQFIAVVLSLLERVVD